MPITNPLATGATHSQAVGYGVTDERSGVRHELSHGKQVDKMVNDPYVPVKAMKPRKEAEIAAALLAHPDEVKKHLDETLAKINQIINPPSAKKHSLQSKFGMALAATAALPNDGDVTGNMKKALAGKKPAPKKLVKRELQVPDPVPAYAEAGKQNETMLSLHRDLKDVQQMQRHVTHMIELIEKAQTDGKNMRNTASLSADENAYRRELLQAHAQDPNKPRQMLDEACGKCEAIEAKIKETKRRIEVRKSEYGDDGEPGAASSSRAAGKKKSDPFKDELAGLERELVEPAMQRRVAIGVLATLPNYVPLEGLKKLQTTLDRLQDERAGQINQGNQVLQQLHKTEIDTLLAELPGLKRFANQDDVRNFIRESLGQVKLDGTYDVTGKDTPPPMIVKLFIMAMEGVSERTPGASLSSDLLNNEMRKAINCEIKAIPGGMAIYEQMTGEKVAAGEARIAHRVEAMAKSTLARIEASHPGAAPQARHKVLTIAGDIAPRLYSGKVKVKDLDEKGRAVVQATRNGFFTNKDDYLGIDPTLQTCNDFAAKLQGDMIANTKPKSVMKTLWNSFAVHTKKTPLADQALNLAALTSTLGYDDLSRPQKRMDDSLNASVKHLRSLVSEEALNEVANDPSSAKAMEGLAKAAPNVAAGTLSPAQVLRLAGILTAEKVAKKSMETPRPGHVTVEAKDAALFKSEWQKLQKLQQPGAGALTDATVDAAIKDFITKHGAGVANPYALVDLVDAIAPHVALHKPDGTDNAVRQKLLADVDVIRYLTSAQEMSSIRSTKDLYLFLKPKLQQLELRGKLKMSGGGNAGASTKALTWPLDLDAGALSVVLPIRPVGGGNKVECAVVEFGFSTYAMEMLIGREDRSILNVAAGAGPRISFEPFFSSGAGVDRSITYERSDTRGLWLRVPRGKDDNAARTDMDKALQSLFGVDENGDPVDGGNHLVGHLLDDDGTPLMPKLMGKLQANNPNLSISSIGTMREESRRHESVGNASLLTMAASDNDDSARIQVAAGGARSERRTKSFRQEDATGFMRVTRSNNFSGGSVWEQESLFAVNGLYDVSPESNASQNVGALNRQKQHVEKGVDVKMRHIEIDGETQAVNTRIDIEDLHFGNHMRRVQGLKHDLVALGAEQLFLADQGKTGAHERHYVAADLLAQRLEQSKEKSDGNSRHVHSISFCMQPSAARRRDALNGMAELEYRFGFTKQAELYSQQANDVLKHPQATIPWKVTTSERTSENRQTGVNSAGIVAGKLWKTEGQRGTSSYPK